MNIAFITGITGQDGSYLAEFLLEKGYSVHGLVRRCSTTNTINLNHLLAEDGLDKYPEGASLKLHIGDLIDQSSLQKILMTVKPTEIYNLAAQSHVGVSYNIPVFTGDTNCLGVQRLIDAIYGAGLLGTTKLYQASTSEMFGNPTESPQCEFTPMQPLSPYSAAKLYAHNLVNIYRHEYKMFACCGILFNHESPRRTENFVTRKITLHVAKLHLGLTKKPLELGNIDMDRDWGHAKDYVRAMWIMLQQEKPDDYIVSSEKTHTVREFVEAAFKCINMPIVWEGKGLNEVGMHNNNVLVKINPQFYRAGEMKTLDRVGDCNKIKKLGWKAEFTFEQLVVDMVNNDIQKLQKR